MVEQQSADPFMTYPDSPFAEVLCCRTLQPQSNRGTRQACMRLLQSAVPAIQQPIAIT